MNPALLYSIAGIILFFFGLFALIACARPLRKILAVNVMSSGVFLLLVATAYRAGGNIDPVPHAMVLTGIVVSVSTTALGLVLACRVQETSNISFLLGRLRTRESEESEP